MERLKVEPNNDELKVEIRNFDLLARKAYFNSQWQVKTGAYLLLFGAIVLALALRMYYSLKSKIEQPDTIQENEIASRILAQKGIIIVGALVMVLAFGASFFTVDHLNYYDAENDVTQNKTTPEEEGIQVIEVGENPVSTGGESMSSENTSETDETITEQKDVDAIVTDEPVQENTVETQESNSSTPAVNSFYTEIQKNHNSFRGPFAQGVIYHKNIPTEWDGAAGTNVQWKVQIPKNGI